MKITLDTSILIQTFGRGSLIAQELLDIILIGDHRLVLSNALLAETSRVLRYPRLQTIHGKSEAEIYAFIGLLRSVAEMVQPDPLLPAPIRDPNDAIILQTAVLGSVDVLCTVDNDFSSPPAQAFLRAAGIEVLTARELLDRLRKA
ncbi:MAG: putative toxin-antitoxin system toxin component, PIN family [Bryobacterales bacterium]|nr:putative toxin-antitoxin system toxin component, PIN family [Bryobacterales bacterium]